VRVLNGSNPFKILGVSRYGCTLKICTLPSWVLSGSNRVILLQISGVKNMIVKDIEGKTHIGYIKGADFMTVIGTKIPVKSLVSECFKTHGMNIEVPMVI